MHTKTKRWKNNVRDVTLDDVKWRSKIYVGYVNKLKKTLKRPISLELNSRVQDKCTFSINWSNISELSSNGNQENGE